ncbi:MAG: YIP1 family protein [Methanomicrobiales archaeon]|nr:YIP1 family protein [Methanomicrobiales archaeon]
MLDMNKVKGFLMAPTETFRASKGDSLGGAFRYYTILLVIWAILSAIVWITMGVWAFQDALGRLTATGFLGSLMAKALSDFLGFVVSFQFFTVYALFLISLVGVFFVGFLWHVFALLFGAKKELRQTLKATMYASTPFFLLGWIPIVAVIGWIWYIVLLMLGLSEMQEMSIGEAALAVIVPIILVLLGVVIWGTVISTLITGILGIFI